MKEDAPTPLAIPHKRRQLEAALDRWIVEWLTRDGLAPSVRRRLVEERARRRIAGHQARLGLLVDPAGMTPAQKLALAEYRADVDPAEVIAGGELSDVVRRSTIVFAAPRHAHEPAPGEPGVWAAIRYARHRKVPVRIVLPNGKGP